MATSTELIRAAEHMRNLAANRREKSACDFRMAGIAADELEREAARIRVVEAQQPKRSWPEGWPPFAVPRRAYESLGVPARPSTKWLESHGYGDEKTIARAVRWEWTEILRFSDPSPP